MFGLNFSEVRILCFIFNIQYDSKLNVLLFRQKNKVEDVTESNSHIQLFSSHVFISQQVRHGGTCALAWDSSHHMLTPPLATLPDRTKNRLSGVSRRTHIFVSFEMVVMTPGEDEEDQS